jgi:uncharacterized protein (DUF305 family)
MVNQPIAQPDLIREPMRRRVSLGLPALLGLLLAAAVLPLGLGLWLARPPGEGSPEVRFARDMSAHHSQAVAMALIMRDRSQDATLRTFAGDIVLTQQSQIGQMAGWLEVWGRPLAGDGAPMDGMGQMMGMAAQTEVNALGELPLAEAEVRFLQLMTSHHQGGVLMAEEALTQRLRPEVRRLAEAVVRGQNSEIAFITELLALRGAAPPAPLQPMEHDR